MLIGTAFLMTSNQARVNAKNEAKGNRLNKDATKNLYSALLQVVRDTENPHSVLRGHSLLADLYGTDGFQGAIYTPDPKFTTLDLTQLEQQATRFAGVTASKLSPAVGTDKRTVHRYLRQRKAICNKLRERTKNRLCQPLRSNGGSDLPLIHLDLRTVLKLDRNVAGQPQPYPLPLTKGYFNGCLLTITSGSGGGTVYPHSRLRIYRGCGEREPWSARYNGGSFVSLSRDGVSAQGWAAATDQIPRGAAGDRRPGRADIHRQRPGVQRDRRRLQPAGSGRPAAAECAGTVRYGDWRYRDHQHDHKQDQRSAAKLRCCQTPHTSMCWGLRSDRRPVTWRGMIRF